MRLIAPLACLLATLFAVQEVGAGGSPSSGSTKSCSANKLRPIHRATIVKDLHPKQAANALAVVRYGTGTGFMVHRESIAGGSHDRALILTNAHVGGGRRFRKDQLLILGDGRSAKTEKLICSSTPSDFALIEIRIPKSSVVQPAKLGSRGPQFDQRIYTIGSARLGFDYSSGTMNPHSMGMDSSGEKLIEFGSTDFGRSTSTYVHQATLPSRGGMSGSPVMSRETNEVLGLICGGGGTQACLVSMQRVMKSIRTQGVVSGADMPLVQRMFDGQKNLKGRVTPEKIARMGRQQPAIKFKGVKTLSSPKDQADATNLGSVFFTGTVTDANRYGHFSVDGRQSVGIRTEHGELAAFLSYRTDYKSIYVSWVGTHPQFMNKGLATNLLEHVQAVARHQGKDKISLHVKSDNQSARRLYEKLGFRMAGKDDGYEVLMERSLTGSNP